jgi:hypothetical protein
MLISERIKNFSEWVDEEPNRIIYASLAASLILFIIVVIFPVDSIISTIACLLFILNLVLGTPVACAKTTDLKARSFWWVVLFLICPLIGLIVILAMDDHSQLNEEKEERLRIVESERIKELEAEVEQLKSTKPEN